MKKLTAKQRFVLNKLLNEEEELVYEEGAGWWIGEDRTNGKLANSLLRACLISDCSFGSVLRFSINQTGRNALKSGTYKTINQINNG